MPGIFENSMKIEPNREPDEAMEARSVADIPVGQQWQYEPKWDGFRCLITRSDETIRMISKSGEGLARYFQRLPQQQSCCPKKGFVWTAN